MKPDLLRRRALVFKAMGHPARLAILDAVVGGERCVGELRAVVGSDLSTVSRHLAVLKTAGIVGSSRRGARVLYSLRLPCLPSRCPYVEAVLDTVADQRGRSEGPAHSGRSEV